MIQQAEETVSPNLMTGQPNPEEAATELNKVNVIGNRHKTKRMILLNRVMLL